MATREIIKLKTEAGPIHCTMYGDRTREGTVIAPKEFPYMYAVRDGENGSNPTIEKAVLVNHVCDIFTVHPLQIDEYDGAIEVYNLW